MKKVAIIGGGIVGATCAFYLSQSGHDVVLYDGDKAQATRAAVGIICPWVSQRRNMAWYELARDGADFYQKLIRDIPNQTFYQQNGTLITHERLLSRLYELAKQRSLESPIIGVPQLVYGDAIASMMPSSLNCEEGLFIPGGAQIDGALLVDTLLDACQQLTLVKRNVVIVDGKIEGQSFDHIVVASGAWINEVCGDMFAVYPQKGQLLEMSEGVTKDGNYPVFMPQGELDILFGADGKVVIGASHENDKGFDVTRDFRVEERLLAEAKVWMPSLQQNEISGYRVGTRAYTRDFTPFYGPLDASQHIYVASGLGSSGLTTGPIIGYRIAQSIAGEPIDFSKLNPTQYLKTNI